MNKGLRTIFVFLVILLFFFSAINIISWYKWYKNRYICFAIDISYFLQNGYTIQQIFSDFSLVKHIVKFVVDIDCLDYLNNVSFIPQKSLLLKIYSFKIYDYTKFKNFVDNYKDKVFSIVYIKPKENQYLQYFFVKTGKKISEQEVVKLIKTYNLVKINFEKTNFVRQKDINNIGEEIIHLRGFLYNLDTLNKFEIYKSVIKIKKAIFERTNSIIYILPSEFWSYDVNIGFIKNIIYNVVQRKIVTQNITKFKTKFESDFLNVICGVVCVILPLLLYKSCYINLTKFNVMNSFFVINVFTILGGILIWGLLQKYEYISMQKFVYGIKLMFVLPILLSPLVVFNKSELKLLFDTNLKIKHFVVIFATFVIFLFLLLRTGNVSSELLLPFETQIRNFIEKFILFRPRFKEIFFAQPLLVVSLEILSIDKNLLVGKMLFCLSIVSCVSILNTFLHLHTPIWLCILRSTVGMIGGYFIGKFLWFIIKRYNIFR